MEHAVLGFFVLVGRRSYTGTIPLTDRLMNPATYGCRKGDGNAPPERLLDGVRVGKEDLLKHFGTTAPPWRVVFELERFQSPVLAHGLG